MIDYISTIRLLVVAATASAAIACGEQAAADSAPGGQDTAAATAASAEGGAGRIINVEVLTTESGSFTEVVRVTGTVQANRDIMIAAEEGGVIREIFANKGASLRAGDPIAKVDDKILIAQVAQSKAQLDMANDLFTRRSTLFMNDKVGTELAYLESKYAAEQAAANHAVLTERLQRTVIRAPISGTLEARDVEIGSTVGIGTPIARIVQLDTLKVVGGVPERYALDITRGTAVSVTFDVLPNRTFDGRIAFVGATVNPSNRTFPIELSISNRGLAVKPEMVATIEAVRRTTGSTFSLPQEALVRVEDGFVVFVVAVDSAGVERAVARPVELGAAQRNRVVINSGINAGERVVVVGQNQLANGDRVRVVGTSSAAPMSAGSDR